MKDTPTLAEVDAALEELQLLMGSCEENQLVIFSALYAKAYTLKLRLMAKEKKDVSR